MEHFKRSINEASEDRTYRRLPHSMIDTDNDKTKSIISPKPISDQTNNNRKTENNNLSPQDGYLMPKDLSKPSKINSANNENNNFQQSSYLEPQQVKREQDTYGGNSHLSYPPVSEKDTYLGVPTGQNYINDDSLQQGYLNEDVLNELSPGRYLGNKTEFIQDDLDDSYLLPRHGSGMSSNSAAPLLKKLDQPGSRPKKTANMTYLPPGAPKFLSINPSNEMEV